VKILATRLGQLEFFSFSKLD